MSNDWQEDILEFHKCFGVYIGNKPSEPDAKVIALRQSLIHEEYEELSEAMLLGNLEKIADGIADCIVVLLGTAISYGIDIKPIWNEVHKSNMAKVGDKKRADGKILKPHGWEPPDILNILKAQTEK